VFWNTGGRSGGQPQQHRQPRFKWWILVLIIGLGFAFILLQTISSLSPSLSAAVATEPSAQSRTTEDARTENDDALYLDDYEPEALPFLNTDPQNAGNAGAEKPLWLSFIDVVSKLAIVIGLLYLTLLGIRWLQKHKSPQLDAEGGATIRVLETVGLTPGRSLHLVTVGDKTLLLGATDHQLSLLTELSELSDTVTSLPEQENSFETALQNQAESVEDAVERHTAQEANRAGWQTAMEQLRAGVQNLRESIDETPR
jgi:flagellar biogenesis protein FliO